jgi:hypothetical protein
VKCKRGLRFKGRGYSASAREEDGEGGRDKRIERSVCVSGETCGIDRVEEGEEEAGGREAAFECGREAIAGGRNRWRTVRC